VKTHPGPCRAWDRAHAFITRGRPVRRSLAQLVSPVQLATLGVFVAGELLGQLRDQLLLLLD
jgi:hypothetical protein